MTEYERGKPWFIENIRWDDVDLSNVDFSRYNVVVSLGRKINKLIYDKKTYFPYGIFKHDGIAYLDSEFNDCKIYLYLIDKNIEVYANPKDKPYVIDEK